MVKKIEGKKLYGNDEIYMPEIPTEFKAGLENGKKIRDSIKSDPSE